jgi:hypothetical protein
MEAGAGIELARWVINRPQPILTAYGVAGSAECSKSNDTITWVLASCENLHSVGSEQVRPCPELVSRRNNSQFHVFANVPTPQFGTAAEVIECGAVPCSACHSQ